MKVITSEHFLALSNYAVGLAWLMSAFVFMTLAASFRDRLLKLLGWSFLCLSAARFIGFSSFTGLYIHLYPFVVSIIYLLLRGVSSYLLIDGAINGSSRYQESKVWLAVSIFSSVLLGGIQGWYDSNKVLDLAPMLFVGVVGFVFASSRFWTMAKDNPDARLPYRSLSILFSLKAVLLLFNTLADTSKEVLSVVLVLDLLLILLVMTFGIILGFGRHRIRMSCDRDLV